MPEEKVGVVTHYFTKAMAAAIHLEGELKVGDTIHIKGHTSDFTQVLDSMQIEHVDVQAAKAGDNIGIKVKEHAREHDVVYKVT